MGLYLKVILRDVDGDNGVRPLRSDEPLKQDFVFLTQKREPCLGSGGGEWRCMLIAPTCNRFALKGGRALVKGFRLKLSGGDNFMYL